MTAHINPGEAIRQARAISHMSQIHLAQAAQVSESTVRRAERGLAISAESMRAICAVLQLETRSVRKGAPAASVKSGPSPWKEGPVQLRTPRGKAWPYKPGSERQDTFVDVVLGRPGVGKSTFLNGVSLAACGIDPTTGAGTMPDKLPRIVTIGFGDNAWLSTLGQCLPPGRALEVATVGFTEHGDFALNPFDTLPGFRHCTPHEKAALAHFLAMLWTSAEKDAIGPELIDIAMRCIDRVYDRRDDRHRKGVPTRFPAVLGTRFDEALARNGIDPEGVDTWWDVADALYAAGEARLAREAQREAVPRLGDVMITLREMDLANDVANALIQATSQAMRAYPMMCGPTTVDVGEARVVGVDLSKVCRLGGWAADRHVALMVALARIAFGRDLFLHRDVGMIDARLAADLAGPHGESFHARRLDLRESGRRLVYDDIHRGFGWHGHLRPLVLRDLKEARKWGVQVALASQLVDDFRGDVIDHASGVWALGGTTQHSPWIDMRVRDAMGYPPHMSLSDNLLASLYLKSGRIDVELKLPDMPFATG